MATVLVFGSHPGVLGYVTKQLTDAGYHVLPTLDRELTLELIAQEPIDVLVLGGPVAHEHREEVIAALRERHPWASVILPSDPDDVLVRVTHVFTAISA